MHFYIINVKHFGTNKYKTKITLQCKIIFDQRWARRDSTSTRSVHLCYFLKSLRFSKIKQSFSRPPRKCRRALSLVPKTKTHLANARCVLFCGQQAWLSELLNLNLDIKKVTGELKSIICI